MIVVDVETGGLDPKKNPLLSIGAVEYENPKNTFYVEIKPEEGLEIAKEALAVNGIDPLAWKEKLSLVVALLQFSTWLDRIDVKNQLLAGENPSFDRDFLKVNFERVGLKYPLSHRTIDIHTLSYIAHLKTGKKITKINLDDTLKFVGLTPEPKPHNALVGATLEAIALRKLETILSS